MRGIFIGALASLILTLPLACDKRSESPTQSDQADSTADPTDRPVSSAPHKRFSLLVMPLTVTLPAGWKLDPPDAPAFLEGPAPAGNLEISLSILDVMDDQHYKLFVDGSLKESQLHPQRIQVHQLTTKTGLPMLDRITYTSRPAHASDSPATTLPSQQLSWNIVVFVPYQQKIVPCSFDLIGLTQQEYDRDQSIVRAMIDTAKPAKSPAFQ